jgi:hypothetical protein
MQWMASHGTDAIYLAILEQDLWAAVENVRLICCEAKKVGISVFIVPSRWAGLFAGAPKVPSLFCVHNPHTWILNSEGKPHFVDAWGVSSSVHYEEVFQFFKKSIDKAFSLWDIQGFVWDEPKGLMTDYSPKAVEKLGKNAPYGKHVQAFCDFVSKLSMHIKNTYPDKLISFFAYSDISDETIEIASKINGLDYFGCDGRPWRLSDGGKLEGGKKCLLGPGERFLTAARKNNIKTMMVIENHNMATKDYELMDKRLTEVLALDLDQYVYFYYPRNIEKPDENMSIISKHMMKLKSC